MLGRTEYLPVHHQRESPRQREAPETFNTKNVRGEEAGKSAPCQTRIQPRSATASSVGEQEGSETIDSIRFDSIRRANLAPDLHRVLVEGGLRAFRVPVVEVLQLRRRCDPVHLLAGERQADLAHQGCETLASLGVLPFREIRENALDLRKTGYGDDRENGVRGRPEKRRKGVIHCGQEREKETAVRFEALR